MHYFSLINSYFRIGILNELQYRANFWSNLLQSAVSLVLSLGGLGLVFSHTDTLAGWSASELLVLIGIYYMMSGVIATFIRPSMELFLQDVRNGTLDFVLIKPADAQFLVSIRRVSIWSLIDVIVGMVLVTTGLLRLQSSVSFWQAAGFLVVLIAGVIIVYSFWIILSTVAFWFIKIENILVIFQSMYQAGRWPVSIYPSFLRVALTFLVPVAFAVTVPAEVLVGRATPLTLLTAILVALIIFLIARWFWNTGVKNYSGASA